MDNANAVGPPRLYIPEILNMIFKLICDQGTLRNVVLTCRRFREIAEPILHQTISLGADWKVSQLTERRIKVLYRSLSENPLLRQYVEALLLPSPNHVIPFLEILPNLHQLGFKLGDCGLSPTSSFDASLFRPLQLTHFVWHYELPQESIPGFMEFFKSQVLLEALDIRGDGFESKFLQDLPPSALPRLHTLICGSEFATYLLPGRNIKSLTVDLNYDHIDQDGILDFITGALSWELVPLAQLIIKDVSESHFWSIASCFSGMVQLGLSSVREEFDEEMTLEELNEPKDPLRDQLAWIFHPSSGELSKTLETLSMELIVDVAQEEKLASGDIKPPSELSRALCAFPKLRVFELGIQWEGDSGYIYTDFYRYTFENGTSSAAERIDAPLHARTQWNVWPSIPQY